MEKETIVIRAARTSDMEDMVDLLTELFSLETDFSVNPARQRKGLCLFLDGCGKHRCLLVAEAGGRIVGMCSAQIVISTAEGEPAAWLEDLVVNARCQGQGIGGRLLSAIESWARKRGVRRMQLAADQDNRPGLDFYRHCAWKRTNLICLRKRLA